MDRLRDPVALAVVGGAVAVGFFALVFARMPDQRDVLLLEGAKAAIGVVPLAFFSVIVADLVSRRDYQRTQADREREQQRERDDRAREIQRELDRNRDDYRRRFLNDVVVSYNRIKGVRRSLRAAGLGFAGLGGLSEEQLHQIDVQMATLNETQLDLERMKREVEGRTDVLSGAPRIHAALATLESYANGPITDWELGRSKLLPGSPVDTIKAWPAFQSFAASVREGGDFGIAATQMSEIEHAIWPDLLAQPAAPR
jgi:hypothetical protein